VLFTPASDMRMASPVRSASLGTGQFCLRIGLGVYRRLWAGQN